jgi:hypothetical protein
MFQIYAVAGFLLYLTSGFGSFAFLPAPPGRSQTHAFTSASIQQERQRYHELLALLQDDSDQAIVLRKNTNATGTTLSSTAEALQRRAEQLRREANALEWSLLEARSSDGKTKQSTTQALFDRLFLDRPLSAEAIARVLREERWTVDQAVLVLEVLYERRKRSAPSMPQGKTTSFQIGDTSNAAPISNETEVDLADRRVQCLLRAAEMMDELANTNTPGDASIGRRWTGRAVSTLKSRWNELRKRDLKDFERLMITGIHNRGQGDSGSNASIQAYMRATLGLLSSSDNPRSFNMTRVMERANMIPSWLPSPLLPYIAAANAVIDKSDVKAVRDRVLQGSGFFVTGSESIPSATVFRGNIRGIVTEQNPTNNVSAIVFEEIQRRMRTEGLADRLQLLLLEDPVWRPSESEPKPRPIIVALPKKVEPDDRLVKQSTGMTLLKRASFPLSIVTTFVYSVSCFALNPRFFDSIINKNDISVLTWCLPVFFGVFAVQATYEGTRWLVAKYRGINSGSPIPLPSSQIGIFGCISSLRSFPPCRSTMMEYSLSGPVACFTVSFTLLIFGLLRTIRSPEAALLVFPHLPVAILKSSLLVGSILTVIAPKLLTLSLAQPTPVHPCFVIGFSGILASSLNLLPIFRLDGGRACTAALGNRIGAIVSVSSLMFLLSVALTSDSSLAVVWGIMIATFRRKFEIPARDEITPVGDVHLGSWIASLTLAILVLAPFPGGTGVL